MSKTSGSSKAKSIREIIHKLSSTSGFAPKGWKTRTQWVEESGMGFRTFEHQLAKLLKLGHAKKGRFLNEDGEPRWYFWINKLSDEDQD